MAEKNNSNSFSITRIYNATPKQIWNAWTDEKQVAQWWGPRGFSITTKSKDVKPGGKWIYTMHGPDGVDYPNITTYFEVEKYSRLTYDHGANDNQAALFHVTVDFKEVSSGKTQMHMTMTLKTTEEASQIKKFVKQVGGNSSWDRLGEFLEKENTGQEKFIINRSFNVDIKHMFAVWTEPNHLSKWLAPTGFEMEFIKLNITEGGSSFYKMFNSQGLAMYGKINYRKISPHHYFEYTQEFSDANENQSRHPMAPTWPAVMLTKIYFTEEAADQTRITIEWAPYGNCTSEELQTFIAGRAGMTMGWSGSFAKLEQYLGKDSF